MAMNTYITVTTLKVNELNAPIKINRWLDGLKQRPISLLPTRHSLQTYRHTTWNWRNGEKRCSTQMEGGKKAEIAILTSTTIDFKTETSKI